jgi:outer membrane protein assembly factor BamA/autotransporter translocation and assembly factor TamB
VRRALIVLAAVLAAAAALVALAHLPAARSLALRWALQSLRARAGVNATAREVSYNLLTLDVRLRGVTATATGASVPFLTAEELSVDLPWSAVFGTLTVERLDARGVFLDIVRNADGTLNLPASGDDSPAPNRQIIVGSLALEDGRVRYRDTAGQIMLDTSGVDLAMTPAGRGVIAGPLSTRTGPAFRAPGVAVDGTLAGTLRYDGSSLTLGNVAYRSPLGEVRANGQLTTVWGTATAQLTLDGTLELSNVSTALAIEPALAGRVRFSGPVAGELSRVTARLTTNSDSIRWQHLRPEDVSATLQMTTDAVRIERASLRLGGGRIAATGGFAFDPKAASIDANWQGVPIEALADRPLPGNLGALLTGRAALDWDTARGLQGLTGLIDTRADAPGGTRTGVTGTARLDLARETWTLRGDTLIGDALALESDLSGRLPDTTLSTSSLRGSISASGDARALESLAARLGATQASRYIESGRVTATLDVSGTIGVPRATGEARVEDLRAAGSQPITAVLPITASLSEVRLAGARAESGGNQLEGNVAVNLVTRALTGDAGVTLTDPSALGPDVVTWHPGGRLTSRVSISGTTRAPQVRATVEGSDLTIAGQPATRAALDVTFEHDVVRAAPVDLTQLDGGRVTGQLSYDLASGRSAVSLRAQGWRLTPIQLPDGSWPASGRIDGSLDVAGTVEHPTGGGQLTLTDVRWEASHLDRAVVDLTLSDAGLAAVAQIPSLALSVDARVGQHAPHPLTAVVTATDTSMQAVLTALGSVVPASLATVEGSVAGQATVSGPLDDPSSLASDIRLTRLDLRDGPAALRLARPAAARYSGTTLTVQDLRLESGTTTADVAGALGAGAEGLTVTLRGALADIAPWLAATGVAPDAMFGGTFDASLGATGALDRLVLRGSLAVNEGRIAWSGFPEATGVTGTITLDNGVLSAPAIRGTWAEATLAGDVRLPLALLGDWLPPAIAAGLPPAAREPAVARVRLDHITPTALAALGGDALAAGGLAGALSLDIDLRADGRTLDEVNGVVQIRELNLAAQGLPITQAQPTRLDITGGLARIASWEWDVAGSRLTVSGQANLTGTRALELAAGGALDLRVLSAFLPDIATGGVGDLALTVGGTASAPVLNGTVRLRGAELRLRDPAVSLSNMNGLVALGPATIDVTGLEGDLNGGRVAIIGGLSYEGLSVTTGSLSLQATGVALDVPRGLRTEVDGSLALTMGARLLVAGQVDIVRGAYREPLSLAVELASATRARAAAPAARPSVLDQLDLNVRLASRDPLIVDNNYGRMDLAVDVRLVGTASAPSIVGRATIAEGGVLYLGGRSYLVDRGVIDFSNPRAIVPDLDLQARARIRGTDESNTLRDYDVTVAITGTPDSVKATLTSDPPRSQADIVSLLATGRLADQVGGAGAAVASEQVLGYLSGDALAFAAQAIGVDAIRFERDPGVDALGTDPSLAGEVNPVQRLTFSRRLTNQVNLTLSQNLVDTGLLTWIVAYAPRPAIEVRTISRDDRSRSYQVRHDVSLGGPPDQDSRADTRTLRVAAIRFSGDPGFDERDLRSALDVSVGSRFDYYRWQEDRDRLRAYYVDRGYRDARVSARRIENITDDDPTVTLEYDVARGPRARLEIEGRRLPGRVVRQLEEIWNNAVIDVSLTSDLADAVRRHLAEQNYLRATVEAAIQPADPGEKRIRITVDAGPRASSRRIVFSGQMYLSEEELHLMASAVGIEAWVRPASLADEIGFQYRQRGLLAATVTAGPIENPDGAATLPVRIVEGEPFAIGQVTVRGAARRTEAAALKDLSLTDGTPYTPAIVRAAQAALEAGYAREGYNAVVTTLDTAIDSVQSRVDLVVTVEEGPQQVLQAVDVTGAEGLRPGVLAEALDLQVNAPVDLNAWYASRRRLFQTGLFQRVDLEPTPVDNAEPGPTQPVRATVSLVRRAPWHLRYGVDVTDTAAPLSEDGRVFAAGLSTDLERYGVWGWPGTVGGAVRVNGDRRIVRGFVTLPSLFGESAASNFFVARSRDYFDREGFTSFITDRTTVTAEQRFLIHPTIQTAIGYQFERNHVFEPNPDPNAVLPLDERLQQTRLTSTIVWDTRNDPFDTRTGLFHSSNVEYGPELGSDVRFIKYSLQQYVFTEPVGGVVTASAVRLGLGRGFGQGLIPSERFFAGGSTTVRGFADNALGRRDFFGDPTGGGGLLVLNQELRFPVYRWVRAVGFLDAGAVFEQARLTFRDLDVGAGFGVRVRTPVGLVRLDIAKPVRVVSPVPQDQRGTRWWFSFGQAF